MSIHNMNIIISYHTCKLFTRRRERNWRNSFSSFPRSMNFHLSLKLKILQNYNIIHDMHKCRSRILEKRVCTSLNLTWKLDSWTRNMLLCIIYQFHVWIIDIIPSLCSTEYHKCHKMSQMADIKKKVSR